MFVLTQLIEAKVLVSIIQIIFMSSNLIPTETPEVLQAEKTALAQFRPLVADVLAKNSDTDEFLLGWLRHHELDIKTTSKNFHEMKRWRKEFQIDSILNETIPELRSNGPTCNLDTFDNDGDPVLMCRISGIDMRKLILNGHKQRVLRFALQWFEKLTSLAREINKNRGKFIKLPVFVVDMGGFNFKQHNCIPCLELSHELVKILLQNYPRDLRSLVLINAPKLAVSFARILTSVFPKHHRETFKLFGTDKEEFANFLLSFIPPNQLAEEYGGTRPH